MILNLTLAHAILAKYVAAWETKNVALLAEVFAPDASYFERYYTERFIGLEAIQQYWLDRVVLGQDNIEVTVEKVYTCENSLIAEWEAAFDDLRQGCRKQIYEVAIMDVSPEGLVQSLREFWDSRRLSELLPARNAE